MFNDLKVAAYLAYKTIVKGHRASAALTVLVMGLVFINLVFLSAILKGALGAIDRQIRVNYVADVVIEHQEDPVKKNYILRAEEVRRGVKDLPGVEAAVTRYKLSGIVAYDPRQDGQFTRLPAEIIGIDPQQERSFSDVASSVIDGEYLPDNVGSDDIILGVNLAGGPAAWSTLDNLGGVNVGRKVRVTFSTGETREYTVRGVFQTKFPFIDQAAFITKQEAESVLGVSGQASQVLVRLADPESATSFVKRVKSAYPNLTVRPWTDYLGVFGEVTQTFDIITGIVSAIGLIVASVIIFILVFISVSTKRRQIGILKAIGIRRRIVIWSYMMQALFYAMGGVAVGTMALGFGLMPYFAVHPLQVPVGSVGLSLNNARLTLDSILLVAAAIVAGFIPSWRAASENILDAIWGA